MKNIVKIFIVMFAVALFSSCYDRDIVDSKGPLHTLPAVENLSYTKLGNEVTLSWQIPANISDEFNRPLEVKIQVVENGVYKNIITVLNEQTSGKFELKADTKYKVIVKLMGYLKEDFITEGKTDKAYSAEGKVLEIE